MAAYPVKEEGLQGMAFTGPKRLYEKAGFMVDARDGSTLVMRKKLDRIIAACGNGHDSVDHEDLPDD